jgi:hypothetical protein
MKLQRTGMAVLYVLYHEVSRIFIGFVLIVTFLSQNHLGRVRFLDCEVLPREVHCKGIVSRDVFLFKGLYYKALKLILGSFCTCADSYYNFLFHS